MRTKKILMVVVGVLAGLALVVALFAGGITGAVFYFIGNSAAAETARDFLRNNERLKADIGEVRDFGSLVRGSIETKNADGTATLKLKVIGARQTVDASVELLYSRNDVWHVSGATYTNEAGKTIELLDKYETDEVETEHYLEEKPGIEIHTSHEPLRNSGDADSGDRNRR